LTGSLKDLPFAAKMMVSFSHWVFDLAADNCFLGQGDEAEVPLQLFGRVAFDLGRAD
jgi:hypothetical protein